MLIYLYYRDDRSRGNRGSFTSIMYGMEPTFVRLIAFPIVEVLIGLPSALTVELTQIGLTSPLTHKLLSISLTEMREMAGSIGT